MSKYESQITEVEHKYSAEEIDRSVFVNFTKKMNPERETSVASWDHYYSGPNLPFEFVRFRGGGSPELTIKIKNSAKNNNSRIEVDLPLGKSASEFLVSKFVGLFGFKENFRIYKFCDIFWFEKVDVVYYVVYNENMTEVGRRIEIEARKDYPFSSEEEAVAAVVEMEKVFSEIGLSAQKRMKKSNWEQFRKAQNG